MHESLFQIIRQHVALSEADIRACTTTFEPVLYPKNRILEEEGKVPGYLYFVVSGYIRLFHYNENGEEVTTHLNCPPGFITAYRHFTGQTRSDENVECITDCELLRITHPRLEALTRESPALKDFSIWVFQQSIAYNESRSRELATLTAEQRYRNLIEKYPALLHNVPMQYIASFLGMKPQSLSRIRRQLIR